MLRLNDKRRSMLCLAASALALGAATSAYAQDTHDHDIDVIVVKSSPLNVHDHDVVGAASILDDEEIKRLGAGNLGEALANIPGVTNTFFGPAAGRPVIRGLGADRVRVLVNGVGSLDASAASPDHAIAAETLSAPQIEVLRGASAIAYGGGAIGGVVNIMDGRIVEERPEAPLSGEVYGGYTSVDDGSQLAGRVIVGAGDFAFTLEGQRREAGIYDIPGFADSARQRALEEAEHDDHDHDEDDDHDHEEEFARDHVENSDFLFKTYSGGVSYIQDWGFVGLAVKSTDAEYGLPGHEHGHEEEDEDHDDDHDHDDHEHEHADPRLVMDQTRIDVRGEVRFDGFINRVRWSGAYSDYEHEEREGDEVATTFYNEGFEGRVEVSHDHGGNWQGAWGLQALTKDFKAEGEEAYIEPVTTQDWGLFALERFDREAWGFEAGARLERRRLNGLRMEDTYTAFSASGSVFARPHPDLFTSVTLSRSERAPTDVEVFANGAHLATRAFEMGDLNLDTEKAWSLEGTLRYDHDHLHAEANVFYADYDGFITLMATGETRDGLDIYQYTQADARLYGFELAANTQLGQAFGYDILAHAGLDYVRGELDQGGNLPRISPLSLKTGLELVNETLSWRADAQFVAEQDETATNELPTDGYVLLNGDVEWRPESIDSLALTLGVRNITDEEVRFHTSYLKDHLPAQGRSVRVSVRKAF